MTEKTLTPTKSRYDEAIELAKEIIDGVELGTDSLGRSYLRAYRLARLMADDRFAEVFRYEIDGYPAVGGKIPDSAWRCCEIAGRVYTHVDKDSPSGRPAAYTEAVERLEAQLETSKARLGVASDPDVNVASANPNQFMFHPQGNRQEREALHSLILQTSERLSARRGYVLWYASSWYYELRFSGVASDVFQSIRSHVDSRIQKVIPNGPKTLISVYDDLKSDNPIDWSNAVHSCRRLLQDLADAIFPARTSPRAKIIDGKSTSIALGPDNYKNRLICFVEDRSTSVRFTEIVGSNLSYIGDRLDAAFAAAQKGSHTLITTRQEAERYVVYTYMIVGDILVLEEPGGAR